MKPFSAVIFCAVVVFSIISSSSAASLGRVRRQAIPKEFANINIENYLKNERAVAFQLKCIVYDGPCDRIGKYLKVTIPELLTNQCTNCDPAQRQRAGRLVQHIQQKFPKEWSDAVIKFQGGQVKKADADRLESLLGVKLDSKLVATEAPVVTTVAPSTTAAPSSIAAPSSTAAPIVVVDVSTTAAPASSSTAASASSSAAPVVTSSTTTLAPSTVAPAVASSVAPIAPSSSPIEISSSAPIAISSSVAPEVSSSVAPAVAPSAVPVVSSTAAPTTSEASASSPPTSDAPANPSSSSPATKA